MLDLNTGTGVSVEGTPTEQTPQDGAPAESILIETADLHLAILLERKIKPTVLLNLSSFKLS